MDCCEIMEGWLVGISGIKAVITGKAEKGKAVRTGKAGKSKAGENRQSRNKDKVRIMDKSRSKDKTEYNFLKIRIVIYGEKSKRINLQT